MKLIDSINSSGIFAQSAYSAGQASLDELGRSITSTYLTAIPDTYATKTYVDNKASEASANAFTASVESAKNWSTDLISATSANVINTIDGKFGGDTNGLFSYNGSAFKVYSAGSGIGVNDYVISITGDYATNAGVSSIVSTYLADFGGYVVTSELPLTGDTKKVYLIKDTTVTGIDQYKEYIYIPTTAQGTTGWNCIGDTSMDLSPYATNSDLSSVSSTLAASISAISAANISGISAAISGLSATISAEHKTVAQALTELNSTLSSEQVQIDSLWNEKLDKTSASLFLMSAISAGANIGITRTNVAGSPINPITVISSKDWTNDIKTASAYASARAYNESTDYANNLLSSWSAGTFTTFSGEVVSAISNHGQHIEALYNQTSYLSGVINNKQDILTFGYIEI